MPIGPITPGSPTTVTPDATPAEPTSFASVSPTMDIEANDVLTVVLMALNVGRFFHRILFGLDTVSSVVFAGPVTFDTTETLFESHTVFDTAADITIECPVTMNLSGEIDFLSGTQLVMFAGSTLLLEGTNDVASPLVCSASGRLVERFVTGVDGNHTYTVGPTAGSTTGASLVYSPGPTNDITYTITTVGAQDGDSIRITNNGVIKQITLQDQLSNPLGVIKNAAGFYRSTLLVYSSLASGFVIMDRSKE